MDLRDSKYSPRSALTLSLLVLAACSFSAGRQHPASDTPAVVLLAAGDVPSSRLLNLLPDGETKRRFILDCTGCHQFDALMIGGGKTNLRSWDDWRDRTAQMLSFAGANTGFPIISPGRNPDATADWLVAHLGDETRALPMVPSPPLISAATDQNGVPESNIEFTEYDLGTADLPHDLALDPNGHVVITGQLSGQMYMLDPATGELSTSPPIPTSPAGPRAIEIDSAGNWWVLLGGSEQIARHDPNTGDWRIWDIGMHPHSIVRDRRGRVWFNGHFTKNPEQIGVLDPSDGRVQTYDVPVPLTHEGGSNIPYGLRMGPDGALWGTQLLGNRLVRFDPDMRRFQTYSLPTTVSGPRRLDVAPNGDVWIPEYAASKLARFDPTDETFTEYTLPIPDALPYVVRVDSRRGWIWIATAGSDALLRFHPADGRFDVHPLPTLGSLVRHMVLDEQSGDLWLAYGNFPPVKPRIVRARVR